MADKTGIEWTDATWNPVTGCTEVSPGCDHCYAKTFAERWRGTPGHHFENGFDVQLRPAMLDLPLRWRRPRRVFVNSMSDLFHALIPTPWLAEFFAVMAATLRHTYQVLTKRHGRMRILLNDPDFVAMVADRARGKADDVSFTWPLPNVWLGVSTENQQWADIRIPSLLDTPAAIRFISAEPLLGPVDLTEWIGCPHDSLSGIDQEPLDSPTKRWRCDQCCASVLDGTVTNVGLNWVIVGGESGRSARPMHPDWARSLRDQCQAAGVAFLFKQHGEWIEDVTHHPAEPEIGINEPFRVVNVPPNHKDRNRCAMHPAGMTALTPNNPFNPFHAGHPHWTAMRRVGKKAAGRVLDGREWNGYPA